MDSSKHPLAEGPAAESHEARKMFPGSHTGDITSATFLDVAVLRCLFITHWQEEGTYWALHFLYNRLRDISEETAGQQQPRRRSNSLPIPKIEVSLYQSTESRKLENNKDFIEVPELKDLSPLTGTLGSIIGRKSELIRFRITLSQSKTANR